MIAEIYLTRQKTANSPLSHKTFPYSIFKQGSDVHFHCFLIKACGDISLSKSYTKYFPNDSIKNEQHHTCRQHLHSVIDGMSRFFCAVVKALHFYGLNFAILLQIIDLKVPREKGDDVGRGVHCMGKVCKAFN